MAIIIVMSIGFLIGYFIFPKKWKGKNDRIQILLTTLLIFSMGVSLGSRENFLKDIIGMGWESLVLCVLPIIGSIIVVYGLSIVAFKNKKH